VFEGVSTRFIDIVARDDRNADVEQAVREPARTAEQIYGDDGSFP